MAFVLEELASRRTSSFRALLGVGALLLTLSPSRVGAEPAPAPEPACPPDLSYRLGFGGFSSLTDGQPLDPRGYQASLLASRQGGESRYQGGFTVTPGSSPFFCNMTLGVIGPTLDAGEGAVDFERSVSALWQQRWQVSKKWALSLSTLMAVQVPTTNREDDTDVNLTLVVAKSFAPGVVYLNLYGETTQGFRKTSGAEVGSLLGYKRVFNDRWSGAIDFLHQNDGDNSLEVSAQWELSEHLTLGPGLAWTFEGGGSFGFGFSLAWQP